MEETLVGTWEATATSLPQLRRERFVLHLRSDGSYALGSLGGLRFGTWSWELEESACWLSLRSNGSASPQSETAVGLLHADGESLIIRQHCGGVASPVTYRRRPIPA
jgi:hypothetical protein